MSTKQHYFGIDFGTTYSSMAWCDPNTGRAEVIYNDHDETKTPSLVFFGENDEILVGNDASNKIEEYENSDDPEERDYVSQRIVRSIKRRLINPPLIPPIPGYGDVRPVEVVILILGKLKHDAEKNHFDEQIERVVLTCPAISSRKEREVLREAAKTAGFKEVELLEEPTAAAVAVHEQGLKIGKGVLIYDLGAGTFDLSVVVREEDGTFFVPMESQGNPMLGGDDFDLELYRHCDGVALKELGRSISLTGELDLPFLKQCRTRKENLSRNSKSKFSSLLGSDNGSQRFRHEVDRETFEGLIRGRVEGTVRQTVRLYEQAESRGHEVDNVVLIGGSSQVPLVGRMLGEELPKEPRNFAGRTHAVALGAAYHAYELWKPVESKPREEYRKAVEEFGAGGKPMTPEAKDSLGALARRLRLDSRETAAIEKEVLGDTTAAILAEQEATASIREVSRNTIGEPPGLGGWTSDDVRAFGIDFGTANSSMAWYNPSTNRSEIIQNDEGEYKTPSLVCFRDDEILVGKPVQNLIEHSQDSDDPEEREYVSQRLVRSIKRYLINPPLIPVPGWGDVQPVEVVALILGKLKKDAEHNHFLEEIERVVLTCPAIFGAQEREVLGEAARMAGFREVKLLEEPTAAALAVHNQGLRIGKGVLIYDLGAGTFDLSVVVRKEDGTFFVPVEPQGNPTLGGDDFDLELYRHCDEVAQKELGRPISLTWDVDPPFLKQCRISKERLSRVERVKFASFLASWDGSTPCFRCEIDRSTFEELIRGRVEGTVWQTMRLYEQAESQGHEVDMVVLIGGSSQVPLVGRMLGEALPIQPRSFAEEDYVVALGAAYHAHALWSRARDR